MITNRLPTSTQEEIERRFILLVPTVPDWFKRAQPWFNEETYPYAGTLDEAQAEVDDTFFCFDVDEAEWLPLAQKYAEDIYQASGNVCGISGIWYLYGSEEEIKHEYEALRDFFYNHAEEFPTFVKAFKLADQTQKDIIIYEGEID